MPTWPIEMPSDTLIVPNSSGYPPAVCTPSFTALASRSSDRLHGVISFQLEATPTWGFAQSSSPIPTARNIPRLAVASSPSVTVRLRGFTSTMRATLFPPDPTGSYFVVLPRALLAFAGELRLRDRRPSGGGFRRHYRPGRLAWGAPDHGLTVGGVSRCRKLRAPRLAKVDHHQGAKYKGVVRLGASEPGGPDAVALRHESAPSGH